MTKIKQFGMTPQNRVAADVKVTPPATKLFVESSSVLKGRNNVIVGTPVQQSGEATKVLRKQGEQIGKTLQRNNAVAVAHPVRAPNGTVKQDIQMATGHGARMLVDPAYTMVVPTQADNVYPQSAKKGSANFVTRTFDKVIGYTPKTATERLEERNPNLARVPHEFLTGILHDVSGTGAKFMVDPVQGTLHRFDDAQLKWLPCDERGNGQPAREFSQLCRQGDNKLWAVRDRNELVCITNPDNEMIGDTGAAAWSHTCALRSFSVDAAGNIGAIDEEGQLVLHPANGETVTLSLELQDETGGPALDRKGKPVRPERMAGLGDRILLAASDGKLYIHHADALPTEGSIAAQRAGTPDGSAVVDFVVTTPVGEKAPQLHAICRNHKNEVTSAPIIDGAMAQGYRFDNALVYTNRRGLKPVAFPPENQVLVDPSTRLEAAVIGGGGGRRARLHACVGKGAFVETNVENVSNLKANPLGQKRLYALQKVDNEQYQVVEVNLKTDPTHTPSKDPRIGTVPDPISGTVTALGKPGQIIDYALIQSHGDEIGTKRDLFTLTDSRTLHLTDLNENKTSQIDTTGLPADVGIEQIAVDRGSRLIARGDDHNLYQFEQEPEKAAGQDDAQPKGSWKQLGIDPPLPDGHTLAGVQAAADGRLRLQITEPAIGKEKPGSYFLDYNPVKGTTRPSTLGHTVIDTLEHVAGKEFQASTSAPNVHTMAWVLNSHATVALRGAGNGLIGFGKAVAESVASPLKSMASHLRVLPGGVKAFGNLIKHQSGREGLEGVYKAINNVHTDFTTNRAPHTAAGECQPVVPDSVPARITALKAANPEAATVAQGLYDDLMRDIHYCLQHIGYREEDGPKSQTRFLDSNMRPDSRFVSKPPKGFDAKHDLLADVRDWFTAYFGKEQAATEGGALSPQNQKIAGLLDDMLLGGLTEEGERSGQRMYLKYPQSTEHDSAKRDRRDRQGLLKARLLENIQSLGTLEETLRAKGPADVPEALTQLGTTLKATEIRVKSSLAVQDLSQLEDVYDLGKTMAKGLGKSHHPMFKDFAKAYGATDVEDVPEKMKQLLLNMKVKEVNNTDMFRWAGVNVGYFGLGAAVFAFFGGNVNRNYNCYVEVLGTEDKTGPLAFVLERQRGLAGEFAAGLGKTDLHHLLRTGGWAEVAAHVERVGGTMFLLPRENVDKFVDTWLGEKDLLKAMQLTTELESVDKTSSGWETTAHLLARIGAPLPDHQSTVGWVEYPGASFSPIARLGIDARITFAGREREHYKIHGADSNDFRPQPGIENHPNYKTGSLSAYAGFTLRNWINFPASEDSMHQAGLDFFHANALGMQLSMHWKDGFKAEFRSRQRSPEEVLVADQWNDLLKAGAEIFPDNSAQLMGYENWIDSPAEFADKIDNLKALAGQWRGDEPSRAQFIEAISNMQGLARLAVAGRADVFGVIHELRTTTPSTLSKPGFKEEAWKFISGQEPDSPMQDLHRWQKEDPTFKGIIDDIKVSRPSRMKVRFELTPQGWSALRNDLLNKPNMSSKDVDAFVQNPKTDNMRIVSIEAFHHHGVESGSWHTPILDLRAATSVEHQDRIAMVNCVYGKDQRNPIEYKMGTGEHSQRPSERKRDNAFGAPHAKDPAAQGFAKSNVTMPQHVSGKVEPPIDKPAMAPEPPIDKPAMAPDGIPGVSLKEAIFTDRFSQYLEEQFSALSEKPTAQVPAQGNITNKE